jgi:hypothetical protein
MNGDRGNTSEGLKFGMPKKDWDADERRFSGFYQGKNVFWY